MRLSEYDQSAVKLADAALTKILQFHYNREIAAPKQRPPSGFVFHYTTTEGLRGIVENNELWATSAYFLNDTTEITHGYGVLRYAFDEWLNKNPRPEDSLNFALVQELKNSFESDFSLMQPIFLASFCEEDDLLSQWRGYSQTGGYSLGFKVPPPPLSTELKPEPTTFTYRLVKVEYYRDEQLSRCKAILESILPIFDDLDTARAIAKIGPHPFSGYAAIRKELTDILLEEIAGFKNKHFESEKEWRAVVRRRVRYKQGKDDGSKTPSPIHFRNANRTRVPYIKLIPFDARKKIPIARIRSGPTNDKSTTGSAVEVLLRTHGFNDVELLDSGIPLRR